MQTPCKAVVGRRTGGLSGLVGVGICFVTANFGKYLGSIRRRPVSWWWCSGGDMSSPFASRLEFYEPSPWLWSMKIRVEAACTTETAQGELQHKQDKLGEPARRGLVPGAWCGPSEASWRCRRKYLNSLWLVSDVKKMPRCWACGLSLGTDQRE